VPEPREDEPEAPQKPVEASANGQPQKSSSSKS
jgi:hypothetical protein